MLIHTVPAVVPVGTLADVGTEEVITSRTPNEEHEIFLTLDVERLDIFGHCMCVILDSMREESILMARLEPRTDGSSGQHYATEPRSH